MTQLRILKKQKTLLNQIKNDDTYLTAEIKNVEIERLKNNIKKTEENIKQSKSNQINLKVYIEQIKGEKTTCQLETKKVE